MTFREWLVENDASVEALEWLDTRVPLSPEAVWATCPRGDWLLWWHEAVGTPWEILEPVVRRCVNRALIRAGADFVVTNPEQYKEAARVAWAAWVAEAARAAGTASAVGTTRAAEATWVAEAARVAGAASAVGTTRAAEAAEATRAAGTTRAARAARAAEAAGWYGYAAERQQCAEDCRELLTMPVWVE